MTSTRTPVDTRRELLGEVVTAIGSLGLWAVVWTLLQDFPDEAQRYPRFVVLSLVAFSTIHLLQASWRLYRGTRRGREVATEPTTSAAEVAPAETAASPETAQAPATSGVATGRTLVFIAAAVAYVAAVSIVGFFVTSFVYLVVMTSVALGWSTRRVAATAVVLAAMYGLTVPVLGMRLPTGWLL